MIIINESSKPQAEEESSEASPNLLAQYYSLQESLKTAADREKNLEAEVNRFSMKSFLLTMWFAPIMTMSVGGVIFPPLVGLSEGAAMAIALPALGVAGLCSFLTGRAIKEAEESQKFAAGELLSARSEIAESRSEFKALEAALEPDYEEPLRRAEEKRRLAAATSAVVQPGSIRKVNGP